ncbi:MAG TPA: hypothetical protein ENK47_03260 [Euryarchaeota archaeon]|nr:hypothetical protein [Euryarchaeota archaeon]
MGPKSKSIIELGSQDLTVEYMERFRDLALRFLKGYGDEKPQELIMFSARAQPYQYSSLDDLRKEIGRIPDDASYFYYTITYPSGERCSLYLDPDRPAKLVVEGDRDMNRHLPDQFKLLFPQGGKRYVVHGRWGIFMIWAIVIVTASAFLTAYSLLSHPDPYLIVWVLFISSLLGIYLSLVKAKEMTPANTISLGRRRKRPLLDLFLHFITIALGIISVILVMFFVEYNL